MASELTYSVSIGGNPVSPDLLASIQQIEVEDHALMADMLRLRVAVGVRSGGSAWTVLDDDVFPRLANVKISVAAGRGRPEPLIDAYVVDVKTGFSNQPGQSMLDVVAMDATVKLTLDERVKAWPNMSDSDIASAIFNDHGLTPVVRTVNWRRQEEDQTTIQRGTDMQFLQRLARRNGFECFVATNPSSGANEGHFHPPKLEQNPQGVLTVNMGEATNVNSFNASFDMLRPVAAQATGLDIATQSEQPGRADNSALRNLGRETSVPAARPRRVLISRTGLSQTSELQAYAQAVVDDSAWAIRAEGELNPAAFGRLLRAKQPVLVRGAGRRFSGTYYVEKVQNLINGEGFLQRFALRRNALGLEGRENFVEDRALSSR